MVVPVQHYRSGKQLAVCLRFGADCGYPAAEQVLEPMPGTLIGYYLHMCPLIGPLF
jgi:hypothetical protein